MNIDVFRNYCLSKNGVTETLPFDDSTLVFKVAGKMFALTGLNNDDFKVNLKCNPEKSITLREQYEEIVAGWHMNKTHWNTVSFQGCLRDELLLSLIDESYDLVVDKLPKKTRDLLLLK